jgi:hypothetical protein
MGDDCNPAGSLRCEEDFYCAPDEKGGGSCEALLSAGDPCDQDRECESGNCIVSAGMKLCSNNQGTLVCTGR